MYWYLVLAWLGGLAAVIQSGVSRKLAVRAGLASALHISNLVVLIGGLLILTTISAVGRGDFAQLLKVRLNFHTWSWWFLVPGVMGLFFITMAPFVILKIGALRVFVAVVFGQVLGSLLWDRYMEGILIDRWRVIGCLLTLAGASVFALSDSKA